MIQQMNISKLKQIFLQGFLQICLIGIILSPSVNAQNRFKGGIIAGFNAAQMDGDAAAGYHKVGLNTGVRAIIELKGRYQITTDILFSQRGSRTTENESLVNRTCTLNYLEVPVLLNIRDWQKKGVDDVAYYKVAFVVGVSYSRLFKATANPTFTHGGVLDKFSNNDIAVQGGIQYFQNAHLGFTAKLARSVTKLFNPLKYINEPLAGGLPILREHYLTFQTVYVF
jgi:Outer membrane protein beta-barrel domain